MMMMRIIIGSKNDFLHLFSFIFSIRRPTKSTKHIQVGKIKLINKNKCMYVCMYFHVQLFHMYAVCVRICIYQVVNTYTYTYTYTHTYIRMCVCV